MKKKRLIDTVHELMNLWEARLIPNWKVTYDVVPQAKLNGPPNSWAASNIMRGERRLHTEIASDLPWGDTIYDLEQTVVHEIVHAIVGECGLMVLDESLRQYTPPTVWPIFHDIEEVLVDRIAAELIRAYYTE